MSVKKDVNEKKRTDGRAEKMGRFQHEGAIKKRESRELETRKEEARGKWRETILHGR